MRKTKSLWYTNPTFVIKPQRQEYERPPKPPLPSHVFPWDSSSSSWHGPLLTWPRKSLIFRAFAWSVWVLTYLTFTDQATGNRTLCSLVVMYVLLYMFISKGTGWAVGIYIGLTQISWNRGYLCKVCSPPKNLQFVRTYLIVNISMFVDNHIVVFLIKTRI